MKIYENDFVYGRDLIKKIFLLSVIFCVLTLAMQNDPTMKVVFFILTVLSFVAVFVVLFKHCRCPKCDKVIIFGVMAVTACPRCKRNLITGKKVKKSKR